MLSPLNSSRRHEVYAKPTRTAEVAYAEDPAVAKKNTQLKCQWASVGEPGSRSMESMEPSHSDWWRGAGRSSDLKEASLPERTWLSWGLLAKARITEAQHGTLATLELGSLSVLWMVNGGQGMPSLSSPRENHESVGGEGPGGRRLVASCSQIMLKMLKSQVGPRHYQHKLQHKLHKCSQSLWLQPYQAHSAISSWVAWVAWVASGKQPRIVDVSVAYCLYAFLSWIARVLSKRACSSTWAPAEAHVPRAQPGCREAPVISTHVKAKKS